MHGLIARFLASIGSWAADGSQESDNGKDIRPTPHVLVSVAELSTALPFAVARAAYQPLRCSK